MGKEERLQKLLFRFAHCYETGRLPGWVSCSARPMRLSFYGQPTEKGFEELVALARGYGLVPDVGCVYLHREDGSRKKEKRSRQKTIPILIIGCVVKD